MSAGSRTKAVAAAVAAMVLTGCGSSSSSSSSKPASAPSTSTLSAGFAAVSLPAGSVRVAKGAHANVLPLGHDGRATVSYQDWSSPISMNATEAWIIKHMPATYTPGDLDKYNLGQLQEWDAPANPHQDGPNVTITVNAKGKGATVEVAAWSIPLSGKSAKETLTGVTGATAQVTNDNGSTVTPYSLTLTLAEAKRFAADISALAVAHPVTWSGFAGTPNVTLTFQTARGPRSFLAMRNDLLVHSLGGGPDLIMSGSLEHELNVHIHPG